MTRRRVKCLGRDLQADEDQDRRDRGFRKHGDEPRQHAEGCANTDRSEEHTSELQSQSNLVCRLLLEKKKTTKTIHNTHTNTAPQCRVISLVPCAAPVFFFFFFNDTATTEIYTLSLHDALPISRRRVKCLGRDLQADEDQDRRDRGFRKHGDEPRQHAEGCANTDRSEEHTSELQSQSNLVCRLLLEKKKKKKKQKQVYKHMR